MTGEDLVAAGFLVTDCLMVTCLAAVFLGVGLTRAVFFVAGFLVATAFFTAAFFAGTFLATTVFFAGFLAATAFFTGVVFALGAALRLAVATGFAPAFLAAAFLLGLTAVLDKGDSFPENSIQHDKQHRSAKQRKHDSNIAEPLEERVQQARGIVAIEKGIRPEHFPGLP